ncbi:hypothetical protein ABZ368_19270 [Streptomyces sp. NPDC005908]|uniref:hypothetical protein n=1 Tax=Streptomyces sp. NPDC005908 TaxID=3157084 RepID=UPI0033F36522
MSSTRRASKRARLARRAENDQMRTARRDSLAVLLSRAQLAVPLTADEAALLRAAIEAEIREGDAARQAERGQQRAADRERERVTAAEAAIRELEAERDAVHDALGLAPGQLPHIAPEAIRGRAATIREQAQRAEQAEADAERFKADYLSACQTIAAMHEAATGRTGEGPVRGVVEDVADVRARMLAAEERLAAYVDAFGPDAGDEYRAAQQRAEQAEQRAADLLQRAERAEQDRASLAAALQATRTRAENTEAGDTAALRLAERTARQWKTRAEEAEKAAKAWEHAARRYANNLDAARDHADEAEHRAGRYRLAWLAARRDRKADRAAMAAERPYVEAGQRALAGLTAAEAADNMRQWAAAGMSAAQPVTLATPCANPDCEHPRNWHIGTPGGVCVARGGACPCSGFVAPTAQGAPR